MRRLIQVLVSTAFAALATTAQAQVDYPSKPVRIVCDSAPGSATDVTARIVADALSKLWNQQALIDNVSGAGEILLFSEPSFDVIVVASTPLKLRLVLVVRVPLTEGEILPLPFVKTGGRSELMPASAESKCVKLRVEVGTLVNSSALIWRNVAAVSV